MRMFLKSALGRKIGFGFSVNMLLMVVVGIVGLFSTNRLIDFQDYVRKIAEIQITFSTSKGYVDQYFLNSYSEGRPLQEAAKKQVSVHLDKCRQLIQDIAKHHITTAMSISIMARSKIRYNAGRFHRRDFFFFGRDVFNDQAECRTCESGEQFYARSQSGRR